MQRRDELAIKRHDRALEHKRRLHAKRLKRAEEVDPVCGWRPRRRGTTGVAMTLERRLGS
jgi:hypothetical protein